MRRTLDAGGIGTFKTKLSRVDTFYEYSSCIKLSSAVPNEFLGDELRPVLRDDPQLCFGVLLLGPVLCEGVLNTEPRGQYAKPGCRSLGGAFCKRLL
jgi:hypothetical protein